MANVVKRFFVSPLRVFLVLSVFFGGLMLFVMPPFMVPDEAVHFYRAYQVGEGRLISEVRNDLVGGEVPPVPQPIVAPNDRVVVNDSLSAVQNPAEAFQSFPSSALYSPVPYIPQAIGIDFSRLFNPSLDMMVFFGRLANLMCYIALVAIAIWIARIGKWVFATVGLFPMAIQQSASLSTDVMTIGFSFVLIALMIRLFLQESTINKSQVVCLLLLALGLGLTKQTNIVLLFPLLFLPKRLFGSAFKKYASVVVLLVVGLAAALFWYVVAKLAYQDLNFATSVGIEGVNQESQVAYLVAHPLTFLSTLFNTFIFEGFKGVQTVDFFWNSTYGIFSWFLYKLPTTNIFLGYGLLLIVFLYKDTTDAAVTKIVNFRYSALFTATFFISMIGIATALYIIWTPVGAAQIAGIQGRYLIPSIPLLIVPFVYLRRWIAVEAKRPYVIGILVTTITSINLLTMLVLTNRYFY